MKKALLSIIVVLSASSTSFAQSNSITAEKHIPQSSYRESKTDIPIVKSVPPVKKETGPVYKTIKKKDTPSVVEQSSLRKRPAEVMVDPKPTPPKVKEEQPIIVSRKLKREPVKPELYTRKVVNEEPTYSTTTPCKPCEEKERNNRHRHSYYN